MDRISGDLSAKLRRIMVLIVSGVLAFSFALTASTTSASAAKTDVQCAVPEGTQEYEDPTNGTVTYFNTIVRNECDRTISIRVVYTFNLKTSCRSIAPHSTNIFKAPTIWVVPKGEADC